MLGVLSAIGAGAAAARRGHRRHRDRVLPDRAAGAGVRARASASCSAARRCSPRRCITGGRRSVAAVPDVRLRLGRAVRRLPAAGCAGEREIAMLARLRRGRRLLLRLPARTCRSGRSRSTRAARSPIGPGAVVHHAVAPLPGLRRDDLTRLGHRPRDHQLHRDPDHRAGRAAHLPPRRPQGRLCAPERFVRRADAALHQRFTRPSLWSATGHLSPYVSRCTDVVVKGRRCPRAPTCPGASAVGVVAVVGETDAVSPPVANAPSDDWPYAGSSSSPVLAAVGEHLL